MRSTRHSARLNVQKNELQKDIEFNKYEKNKLILLKKYITGNIDEYFNMIEQKESVKNIQLNEIIKNENENNRTIIANNPFVVDQFNSILHVVEFGVSYKNEFYKIQNILPLTDNGILRYLNEHNEPKSVAKFIQQVKNLKQTPQWLQYLQIRSIKHKKPILFKKYMMELTDV